MERIGDGGADQGGSASRDGGGWPWKSASTACRMKANAERPCSAQVAITVQSRSLARRPLAPRVPWVTWRSMTTKRIACSATLLVGSMPGVVMNVKYASACLRKRSAMFCASRLRSLPLTSIRLGASSRPMRMMSALACARAAANASAGSASC